MSFGLVLATIEFIKLAFHKNNTYVYTWYGLWAIVAHYCACRALFEGYSTANSNLKTIWTVFPNVDNTDPIVISYCYILTPGFQNDSICLSNREPFPNNIILDLQMADFWLDAFCQRKSHCCKQGIKLQRRGKATFECPTSRLDAKRIIIGFDFHLVTTKRAIFRINMWRRHLLLWKRHVFASFDGLYYRHGRSGYLQLFSSGCPSCFSWCKANSQVIQRDWGSLYRKGQQIYRYDSFDDIDQHHPVRVVSQKHLSWMLVFEYTGFS